MLRGIQRAIQSFPPRAPAETGGRIPRADERAAKDDRTGRFCGRARLSTTDSRRPPSGSTPPSVSATYPTTI
jgi:hypothetical protein